MALNDDWISRQAKVRAARKRLDQAELNRRYAKALKKAADAKADAKRQAKRDVKRGK